MFDGSASVMLADKLPGGVLSKVTLELSVVEVVVGPTLPTVSE